MHTLLIVLTTVWICGAVALVILHPLVELFASGLGGRRLPGWRILLESLGWPLMLVFFILRFFAEKIISFTNWLK